MFYSKLNTPQTAETKGLTVKEKSVYIEKVIGGKKQLVNTGEKTDTYSIIQSHRDECDVENIIKRAAIGDVRGLTAKKPMFEDVTTTPKDMMEAMNTMLRAEAAFSALPKEERAKYNNSVEEFIGDIGSDKWLETMGISKKAANVPAGEEQKNED